MMTPPFQNLPKPDRWYQLTSAYPLPPEMREGYDENKDYDHTPVYVRIRFSEIEYYKSGVVGLRSGEKIEVLESSKEMDKLFGIKWDRDK